LCTHQLKRLESDFPSENQEAGVSGGEQLEKMKGEQDLTTIAKASKETGISAGMIRNAFKEGGVKPDLVKAGCSYYSKTTVDSIVKKLKKA
jgi:hypothetical protein